MVFGAHTPRPLHACSLAINKSLITNLLYHVSYSVYSFSLCNSVTVSLLMFVCQGVYASSAVCVVSCVHSFIPAFHSASASVRGARPPLNTFMSSVVLLVFAVHRVLCPHVRACAP